MKSRNPRGLREIGHAHEVPMRHLAPSALEPRSGGGDNGRINSRSERLGGQRAQPQRGEGGLKEQRRVLVDDFRWPELTREFKGVGPGGRAAPEAATPARTTNIRASADARPPLYCPSSLSVGCTT